MTAQTFRGEYEGSDVLSPLLSASRCLYSIEEIVDEFELALEDGRNCDEVFRTLWQTSPRFPKSEDEARLISNLLGLWDLVHRSETPTTFSGFDSALSLEPITQAQSYALLQKLDERSDNTFIRAQSRFENEGDGLVQFMMQQLSQCSESALGMGLDLSLKMWWLLERYRGVQLPLPSQSILMSVEKRLSDGTPDAEPGLGQTIDGYIDGAQAAGLTLSSADAQVLETSLRVVRNALVEGSASPMENNPRQSLPNPQRPLPYVVR